MLFEELVKHRLWAYTKCSSETSEAACWRQCQDGLTRSGPKAQADRSLAYFFPSPESSWVRGQMRLRFRIDLSW